ncbi:MAG: hypothetical protein Q7W51_09300 [Coriobacteriia bacterium]|nr:hypothetical protein [Coriobacteriia bacterium]
MKRFGSRLALLLLVTTLLGALLTPAAVAQSEPRTVVVVLAPYLTWSDVMSGAMPVTRSLAESGSIGDLNVRSSARFVPDPTQTHIALTMSAGSPCAFDPIAASAYGSDQLVETGTAGEAYRRAMGEDPGDAAIVYLGLPRILTALAGNTYDTVPGVLGEAISGAGGSTAAVGNSDGGHRLGEPYRSRPAAVLAMDASGRVLYGDVSAGLLAENADAPYGVSTDLGAFESAYRSALYDTAEHGGPALIVLDAGDPERAVGFRAAASPETAEHHRLNAAATVDAVVSLALEALPDDGVLMVVSTGQVKPAAGPSGYGPIVVTGPGYEAGLLESSSTHRPGLITDLDVSATVLAALGVDRPVEILGNAASPSSSDASLDDRVTYLQGMNDTAVAVDTVRPAVQSTYIALTVIILIVCAALLRPMERALAGWGGRAARLFSVIILLLLAMPVSATLMYLFVRRPDSAFAVGSLFAVTTLVVWALVFWIARRWGSAEALATMALLTAGTLLLDQLFGAPLSFSGLFSYSPLLGARYYGLGNEGASIVVGAGLVGLALVVDAFRDRAWIRAVRVWGPPLLGALVVFASAAPFLGANIGVIAWGTVAFGILWAQLNGRPITWKTVLAMLGLITLIVVGFSIYESLGGSGAQTHLGRAWESAGTGGIAELWTIVARKAETNWRVLRATNWSILMIAILGFLGYMRWHPHGVFAETLKAYPAFAVAVTASLWGSLAGYFTEDSGIVIPALVMLYITGSLLHIMLSRLHGDESPTVSA